MKSLRVLIATLAVVVTLPGSSFAQGCFGWMIAHYSGYQSYTLGKAAGGKVEIYTNSYVDGYTSGTCPIGCGCGGTQHIGLVSSTIKQHSNGVVMGSSSSNSGYVSWSTRNQAKLRV